jgi:hypothetical protein
MEVKMTTNFVIMFACFHFPVPGFQGAGGKFNYNSNLNSPSENGTLVPPVYCTWRLFRLFTQRGAGVCSSASYLCLYGTAIKPDITINIFQIITESVISEFELGAT